MADELLNPDPVSGLPGNPEPHAPADPAPEEQGPQAAADGEAPAGDQDQPGDQDNEGEEAPEPTVAHVVDNKQWYVVKVQSGREESIKDAIERRVKIEGLEEYFGQIIIPVERVTEMVRGKRVVKEKKLYPGYLMVNVEFNDRILYLFRETSGVGDFVGGGPHQAPQPMKPHEVERMLGRQGEIKPGLEPSKSRFSSGDRVKIKDGTFAGMEGEVKEVMEAKGTVKVELTIFGRPVPVELEYWQVDFA
jgi:transcription termination/antitermination protein NusG